MHKNLQQKPSRRLLRMHSRSCGLECLLATGAPHYDTAQAVAADLLRSLKQRIAVKEEVRIDAT